MLRRLRFAGCAALVLGLVLAPSAFADYGGTVLADNPLGYWQLGDVSGPTAVDLSGDGLDGAYAGSVTFGVSSPVYGASDTRSEINGTALSAVSSMTSLPAGCRGPTAVS